MSIDEEIESCLSLYKKKIEDSLEIPNKDMFDEKLNHSKNQLQLDCEKLRQDYLLSIYLTDKNIEYFNENETLLRKLSGISVKALGQEIGISGQALTQFEKTKNFPRNRIKTLMKFFIKQSINLIKENDYRLFNCIYTLFFFDFQKCMYNINSKHELFDKFVTQQECDEIKKNFILDLDSFKNYPNHFRPSLWFSINSFGEKKFFEYITSSLILEGYEIIEKINKNLKNLRYLMDKEQEAVATILGLTPKTYNYYENYDYKPGKIALDFKQVCLLINEVFNHISNSAEHKEEHLFIMQMIWPNNNPDYEENFQKVINDYCIAVKYKQSNLIFDFFKNYFSYLQLQVEYNLPIGNYWELKNKPEENIDAQNIFN